MLLKLRSLCLCMCVRVCVCVCVTKECKGLACIWTSGSGPTVNIQHPVRVGPREYSPLLSLGLERRVSVPVEERGGIDQQEGFAE